VEEAARRLLQVGPNRLHAAKRTGSLFLLATQFRSPITLILIGAAVVSFFLHDVADAAIVLGIVFASALLGFWQERGATQAVARLLDLVRVRTTVLRDGQEREIPVEDVVPGDVVQLRAGAVVPADGLLLYRKRLARERGLVDE